MTKKYFMLAFAVVIAAMLTSCADSFLNQYPGGSTITEEQYQNMDNAAEGLVKGVYSKLYEYGGEHDLFAQRAIDMYGDLLCGDMALKTQNYGWFGTDEMMMTFTRRSYYWSYYYGFIRACNKGINAVTTQGEPTLNPDEIAELTEDMQTEGIYYAQLLTIRGWAYAGLLRTFTSHEYDENALAFPLYTEIDTQADTILGRPRSSCADIMLSIEEDLSRAISYFEAYSMIPRASKLEVNEDVARITLAYMYLNIGDNEKALQIAEQEIQKTTASVLPKAEVLTSGFNNVENKSWVWGLDVTVENTTSLASFFGQCDIYTYSYAGAGDVKGIDQNLYDEIPSWDLRKKWWNNYAQSGVQGASAYAYAPDGKFYSATSTKKDGDRDWLSDQVYMRIETAYLIAAEAACRTNDNEKAKQLLFSITDLRCADGAEAEYQAWKNGLTTNALVLQAIRHNWRVELWGEGYGLQTFRRFNESVTLGDNHLRTTKTISPTLPTPRYFTFELPTNELYYNPYIRDNMETTTKANKVKQ